MCKKVDLILQKQNEQILASSIKLTNMQIKAAHLIFIFNKQEKTETQTTEP